MARLTFIISLVFVLSALPTSFAGPALARKHYNLAHWAKICKLWGCDGTAANPSTTTTEPIPSTSTSYSSSTTPTPTPAPPPSSNADIQNYLQAHNSARSKHGAAPLTWSDDLGAKAQQWASACQFKHSGGSLGDFGENLAAGTGDFTFQNGMDLWMGEASNYDPKNPVYSHFTQVVWKSTTQVGCAVAACSGIFDASYGLAQYYVCEYSPPGNIIGEFAENVQA